jgi:hypothetical protein
MDGRCPWQKRTNADDGTVAANSDFYIVTFDTGEEPLRWCWQLRRRSTPMGVKIGNGGYQSRSAAEFAGKRALEEFLKALASEERKKR